MHRSQLNTSRGPWKSKRARMGTRKISALPGRTRENKGKEQERSGMGPPTLGGSEERRGLHTWGSSSLRGRAQLGQKGSLIFYGKRTRQESEVAGQSETSTQGTEPSPAHPAWEGVHCCRQGLGTGMWGLKSRPRQRTAVACEETSWGDGREGGGLHMGVHVEEAWTTIEQSTVSEWCQRRSPLQSLAPCAGPCSPGTRKGSHWGGLYWASSHYLLPCISSTYHRLLCSGTALGTATCEWANCTDGGKAQLNPSKEKKLKSLVSVTQTTLLHPQLAL